MAAAHNSRRGDTHQKSMRSYVEHARQDAMAIAELLGEAVGAPQARLMYEEILLEELAAFRLASGEEIKRFISMTRAQRQSHLKAITKLKAAEKYKVLLMVLAINGCTMAGDIMEVRDDFRTQLVPGSGNRETTAAIFSFSERLRASYTYNDSWPYMVFMDCDVDDGCEPDDVEDMDENGVVVSMIEAGN